MDKEKKQPSYEELLQENIALKNELSENIIICSMNDMKVQYETLKRSTIPIYKYNDILSKYTTTNSKLTACIVILDHLQKQLSNNRFKFNVDKLQVELLFLKEILEN